MLRNLSIPHGGLSEPHLTASGTSRKYFEIHLEIDDANKLDKALKSDTSLSWFVIVILMQQLVKVVQDLHAQIAFLFSTYVVVILKTQNVRVIVTTVY